MDIAHMLIFRGDFVESLQAGGCFRCELSSFRLPGEDRDLAEATNILVTYMFRTYGLCIIFSI